VNAWVPPISIEGVAGVTAIDAKVATVTVKVAELVLPPKLAVMSALPPLTPEATPEVLLTVATPVVPELQLEEAVTSRVVPSLYVAVAMNAWMALTGIEGVAGVTAIDTNVAAVTVKLAVPVLPPKLAVMTEVPPLTAEATPEVLLTVATPVVPELQLEEVVTSRVVPSL